MSEVKLWFGISGGSQGWYLLGGPADFVPIDIDLLPGPKPIFTPGNQITTTYTGTEFDSEILYKGRILANTADGTQTFDALLDWNLVKNMQLTSSSSIDLLLDGIVHADVVVGLNDAAASHIDLIGIKRANVVTGLGNDTINIEMVTDIESIWVDDFRIATGAGDDVVSLKGLDIAAKLAAGDTTYIQAYNKPGLPLSNEGAGREAYIALGDGNDRVSGYTSNEHVIAGRDTGTVKHTVGDAAPTGFGYAVGGSTKKGGCDSVLYKIDLKTGAATAVGEVQLRIGFFNLGGLDVESLSMNPKDGMLYGFASKFGILDALVKIDPLTAKTTYIKLNISNWHDDQQDMAFDSQGNLFFVSNGDFMRVDIVTGAIKTIGNNTLNCDIAAMSIDPVTGKVFAIGEVKGVAMLYEIDKANGKVLSSGKLAGVDACPEIEGMSFDSAGKLWAVDNDSGKMFTIDTVTRVATRVSTTLTDKQQYGDGFEALAIQTVAPKVLKDLAAVGGDAITTGGGSDVVYYAHGDGVDTVTDFDVARDKVQLVGIDASKVKIDTFNGDTFIRFIDNSADGFVDNAMIELQGVTGLSVSQIVFGTPDWW
jgi:hypothetical protein